MSGGALAPRVRYLASEKNTRARGRLVYVLALRGHRRRMPNSGPQRPRTRSRNPLSYALLR